VENLGLLTNYNSSEDYCSKLKINIDDTQPTDYFVCSEFHEYYYPPDVCSYLTIGSNKNHCMLGHPLSHSVSLSDIFGIGFLKLGFVKFNRSFIISDDLVILPHSMNHTIYDLSNNFGIQSTSSIKEVTVNVTKEKVLYLQFYSLFHSN
jgi:hypothetical protein